MANYIFVARADRVFEIGEIEVGSRWVVGVVFVGDHDDDDDARSGEVFCSFSIWKWWWSFPLLFVLGRQRRMSECWLGRVDVDWDGK